MMEKIAIIELYGHIEVMYAAMLHFNGNFLTLYTTKNGVGDMPEKIKRLQVEKSYVLHENDTKPKFIKNHFSRIQSNDLIIFTTVLGEFSFWSKIKWTPETLLVIHNGNYWFDFFHSISIESIKDVLRLIRTVWKREFYHRKKILLNTNYILFPNNLISSYFIEKVLVEPEKVKPSFPFYWKETVEKVDSKEFNIIVPGTVYDQSREYSELLKALMQIAQVLKTSVNLVFLGNVRTKYGKQVLNEFRRLSNDFLKIVSFKNYIPQRVYDDWLKKADCLILPIKEQMKYGICKEIPGKTKITGTINDMHRFNIPTLLPDHYYMESPCPKNVSFYSDHIDLIEKLNDLMNT